MTIQEFLDQSAKADKDLRAAEAALDAAQEALNTARRAYNDVYPAASPLVFARQQLEAVGVKLP